MELNNFIEKLANQFDDTDISELTADCNFQELDEWSSLSAMGIIAFVKMEYGKSLTARDIRSCDTIEDLFKLVESL